MTYPIGMTCQELVELVTEYLEGTMPRPDRARFEKHLAVCPGCVEYVEQIRQTVRASGRLREESLDAATRDRLLDLFRDWKQTR